MRLYIAVALATLMAGCAQPSRLGMTQSPKDGVMWGSAVERNIVIDPSQLENRMVRVSIRNVSGDTAYDLADFRSQFERALRNKGYDIGSSQSLGVKFDVNVLYSGHVRQDLSGQFGFLGALGGGVVAHNRGGGGGNAAAGALAGAALGAIAGSYVQDETYIAVIEVTIGIADQYRGKVDKTVTFSSSPVLQEERRSSVRPFEHILKTKVAVYAGGRNVAQSEVADLVRERLARIISDVI